MKTIPGDGAGLDVVERWRTWTDDGKVETAKTIDWLVRNWGGAAKWGDPTTNDEILALGLILCQQGIAIPSELKTIIEQAINVELQESELCNWADSVERKAELVELMTMIGGTVGKPTKVEAYVDEVIHLGTPEEAKVFLVEKAKIAKKEGYITVIEGKDFKLPDFARNLHRLVMSGIREKDWHIERQAKLERKMIMAWYLGLANGMSIEEIEIALGSCTK